MCIQTALAVSASKLSAQAIQWLHMGSGTSLPGKVGLRMQPNLLAQLSRQIRQQTIAITGTNGKSTTAGLLAAALQAAETSVVHNQLGANMVPGITAALIQQSNWMGKLNADFGVIEADEASLPQAALSIRQDYTVVTNLFRDQLDRYGELDTTAKLIAKGITHSGGKMILNADDPMVAYIGHNAPPDSVLYFGVEQVDYPSHQALHSAVAFPREVTDCPACAEPLAYTHTWYGHLGHYACTRCHFKRPQPQITATHIQVQAAQSVVHLQTQTDRLNVTLALPGLFNAYNLLAAAAALDAIQVGFYVLPQALMHYHSIFGRAEKRVIEGKSVVILLIKNPIGAAEVLRVLAADPQKHVLIMINDNYADGRDISWLWDAPFEYLADTNTPIIVSGHRAADMAVRLKYAGIEPSHIAVHNDTRAAFNHAVTHVSQEETLYVLPTYTALLQLSADLQSR